MRVLTILIPALLAGGPLLAQDHQHHAPARGPAGEMPEGWQLRLDRADANPADAHFTAMEGGYHIALGPSAIFWNPEKRARGDYRVKATFTQATPVPREAFGLFIGGRDLDGAGQRYTYFLIRQDGRFLVKRRDGAETPTLVDWTEHPAVRKGDESTTPANELAIHVVGDAVRFLANGVEIASLPRSGLDTDGIVGLRANHRLELHVTGFAIEPATRVAR